MPQEIASTVTAKMQTITPGVVACNCNPAILEAKFWNGVGSTLAGGNSPSEVCSHMHQHVYDSNNVFVQC